MLRLRVESLGASRRATLSLRPNRAQCRIRIRAAAEGAKANPAEAFRLPEDDPHQILRVARGTDYLGLLSARREARAKAEAEGDDAQVVKVEAAFRTFVDGAEKRFKEAVDTAPDDAAALYMYANFLQTIESFDEAEQLYRRTLEADPTNADALNNLAMLLHEQKGDLEAADALYAQGSTANPEDVDLLFNWATLKKEGLGDAAAANELVDKVLQLKPELAEHPLVEAFRK